MQHVRSSHTWPASSQRGRVSRLERRHTPYEFEPWRQQAVNKVVYLHADETNRIVPTPNEVAETRSPGDKRDCVAMVSKNRAKSAAAEAPHKPLAAAHVQVHGPHLISPYFYVQTTPRGGRSPPPAFWPAVVEMRLAVLPPSLRPHREGQTESICKQPAVCNSRAVFRTRRAPAPLSTQGGRGLHADGHPHNRPGAQHSTTL